MSSDELRHAVGEIVPGEHVHFHDHAGSRHAHSHVHTMSRSVVSHAHSALTTAPAHRSLERREETPIVPHG